MGEEAWRTKRRWELHPKAMGRWASDGTALRRRPCIYFFRKWCIKKTIEIAWLLFVRWLWWWKETRWLRDGPVVRYRTETFCSIDGGKRPCGSRREGAGEVSGFAYLKLLCFVCGKIKMQIWTQDRTQGHVQTVIYLGKVDIICALNRLCTLEDAKFSYFHPS